MQLPYFSIYSNNVCYGLCKDYPAVQYAIKNLKQRKQPLILTVKKHHVNYATNEIVAVDVTCAMTGLVHKMIKKHRNKEIKDYINGLLEKLVLTKDLLAINDVKSDLPLMKQTVIRKGFVDCIEFVETVNL